MHPEEMVTSMAVMEVPRIRRPQPAQAPDGLWELFETLDLGELYRIEFIEGRIVVSGVPYVWHELVITWMRDQFADARHSRGWGESGHSALILETRWTCVLPDLVVFEDADRIPRLQSEIPAEHVLLAMEVTSRDSKRVDREVKPNACAKAGIPLYLLVDRFTKPVSVTLLSVPGENGYTKAETVPAGPHGGKLHIPAPFEVTLDTGTLPMP
jgi:Uma2 family endonuclease